MAENLTDEQIIEFKNAYRSFCKEDHNPLPVGQLGIALRTLGYYPSEEELDALITEFDPEGMGWLQQHSFYQIMARKVKEKKVKEEDIKAAFQFFDRKSNGFVSAEELRHILLEIGERFTDEEMNEFLKHAAVDEDGQIYYEDFIIRMMTKHPLLRR